MNLRILVALTLASLALPFESCNNRTVTRVNPNTQTDISGRWNDTDSKLVAEEMIKDVFKRPWRQDFIDAKGKKPTVIIGSIKNKTSEFISAETFIKDLEKEFVNSGLVSVVQSGSERDEIREERNDQQTFATEESRKKWGLEKGADFMMNGSINSITDQYKKEKAVFYKINLELTNLETNEKVWIGDKKIKKAIQN